MLKTILLLTFLKYCSTKTACAFYDSGSLGMGNSTTELYLSSTDCTTLTPPPGTDAYT
jgi:hypothetical protein